MVECPNPNCTSRFRDNAWGRSGHFSRCPPCLAYDLRVENNLDTDSLPDDADADADADAAAFDNSTSVGMSDDEFPGMDHQLSSLNTSSSPPLGGDQLSDMNLSSALDISGLSVDHDTNSGVPDVNDSEEDDESEDEEEPEEETDVEELSSEEDDDIEETDEEEFGENVESGVGRSNLSDVEMDVSSTTPNNNNDPTSFLSGFSKPTDKSPFTESEQYYYQLLHLIQKAKAPLWVFKEFCDLARKAQTMPIPLPKVSRKATLSKIKDRYNLGGLDPVTIEETLPASGFRVKITCHDFAAGLGSLLSDPYVMQDKHLLFYEKEDGSPLGRPSEVPPEELEDILDGDVCRAAYKIYVKSESDLMVPVIFFIDKTHVDRNGRLKIEPVCFTLGIFRKEYRRLPEFWRTLGYVNTMGRSDAEGKAIFRNMDGPEKIRDYHYVLNIILKSYKDAQVADLPWTIQYKGRAYDVRMRVPLLYVIGDTEGHDKLCAHYQCRANAGIKSLCRYCDCPNLETGNPRYKGNLTRASTVQRLVDRNDKKKLQQMSYHCVENAFNGVLFCDPNRGINGATPVELLHLLQHGLFLYSHEGLDSAKIEVVGKKKKKSGKKDQSGKKDHPTTATTNDGGEMLWARSAPCPHRPSYRHPCWCQRASR